MKNQLIWHQSSVIWVELKRKHRLGNENMVCQNQMYIKDKLVANEQVCSLTQKQEGYMATSFNPQCLFEFISYCILLG